MTNPLRPHPGTPSVLIVLLNWNSFQDTIAALHSVLAMDYPNFSVLIVDNGSTDQSVAHLQSLASDRVHLLFLPENTGYTGGCNRGIELALDRGDDFIWLLNNDAITSPDTLSSLVRFAQTDPCLALVSPRILSLHNPDKFINLGGVFLSEIPTFQTTRDPERALRQARDTPDRVIVLGTALLLRTSVIRQIGPFDHNFFAYWEDSDLSVRSIRAGFRNAVDFDATVFHKEKDAATDANSFQPHYWYYMARNEVRFWRKHASGLPRLKALWWSLQTNRDNLRRLTTNSLARHALLAGLWDGWFYRTGPWHPGRHPPTLLQHVVTPRSPTPSSLQTQA